MAGVEDSPQLKAGLDRLWRSSLPAMQARLAVLEAFAKAAAAGSVPTELRIQAEAEAHKLSGVLGTFGYPEGSAAARTLEEGATSGAVTEQQMWDCLKVLQNILEPSGSA